MASSEDNFRLNKTISNLLPEEETEEVINVTWRVAVTLRDPLVSIKEEDFQGIKVGLVRKVSETEDELIEVAGDVDAAIISVEPFTRKVIENLRKCRIIATVKTGYDNIDIEAATEQGICVSTGGDYCSEDVATHAMALLLACTRKIVRLFNAAKLGHWCVSIMSSEMRQIWKPMFRLRGQTLGIVGLGRIGQALVPKAKGFGLNVVAYDPYVSTKVAEDAGVEMVNFKHLLNDSDFVSINAVLTDETRKMFGLNEFKEMKPSAFLINTARGGIVDTDALCTAISEGYIAGVGLDVVDPDFKPLSPNHPLFKMDNVIVTGHSAFYSETSYPELSHRAPQEVSRVLSREWPRFFVNPEVKENFRRRFS